jgi:hypothetical protein
MEVIIINSSVAGSLACPATFRQPVAPVEGQLGQLGWVGS